MNLTSALQAAAQTGMTWGRHYWPWFLITGSLGFGIPELIALFTNSANTLSVCVSPVPVPPSTELAPTELFG